MENYEINERNRVRRVAKRGAYDKKTVFDILDADFLCHIGFSVHEQPFVIPTTYGRMDETVYIHGAAASRMLLNLQEGIPLCLTVTMVDGLVLARSAFHHSMNYRSVMLFGTARLVTDSEEKNKALFAISENILKGRWDEVREPNEKELQTTSVLALDIEQASAKIRTGHPIDDKKDYDLPIWAGVVPLQTVAHAPITDPAMKQELPVSQAAQLFTQKK